MADLPLTHSPANRATIEKGQIPNPSPLSLGAQAAIADAQKKWEAGENTLAQAELERHYSQNQGVA